MDVISRAEARAAGLKRYFTGKPCSRGHVCERIASSGACLICNREKQRAQYSAAPETERQKRYAWIEANRERHLKAHREREKRKYAADPEKYRTKQRQRRIKQADKWREYDRKYRSDPIRGLAHLARVLTAGAMKRAGHKKGSKTEALLGCTVQFLKEHLERQFLPGMTWENRGEWHVDHIVPISSAKTIEEAASLCHFTNLRPLWGKDNISKRDKRTHLI